MKSKFFSTVFILSLIISFAILVTVVAADGDDLVIMKTNGGTLTENEDFIYENGILTILKGGEYTIKMNSGVTSTSDAIKIDTSDAVTITLSNVNISASGNAAIDVSGNSATIILSGSNTLYSSDNPAIHVSSGSLTISGDTSDTVNVTTSSQGAAIGGGYTEEFSGKINIIGGTVNATNNYSGYDGAGIGSGNWGVFSGSINISGGKVTGSSTTGYGAGIGSGSRGVFSGNINISGGTVTGYSGDGSGAGAGIGAGRYGNFTGSINITDGTVTGYSKYGAGIGSGAYANSLSGSINIEGGTVIGSSERGAGIGAGEGVDCSGSINISGGTVNASATSGASIGVGSYCGTLSGNINISGGYMAFSSVNASALGAGETSTISGTINIIGGYFGDSSFIAGEYGTGKIYGCDVADGYLVCANAATSTKDEYPCYVTLSCSHLYTDGFCTTCGAYEPATISSEGIYEISNAGQLFWFAALVNGTNSITYNNHMFAIEGITAALPDVSAVLTNDIDLSVTTSTHTIIEWTPIGNKTTSFSGTFDGAGYTVSGMSITKSADYVGLFGYVTGTVKNMTVGGSINVSGSEMCVGGIMGTVYDGTLSGLTSTVTINGTDDTKGAFGGVAASAEGTNGTSGSTVEKCVYSGSLTAGGVLDCIGGIVGYMSVATINNCANCGTVDTTGGTKAASGGIYTGGIVSYCNNANAVITNCYNYGIVSGAGANTTDTCYTGAVIGRINRYVGEVSNCYYLSTSAGTGIAANGSSVTTETTAKDADEFASGEVAYLLTGGTTDGTQAWYQNIDNGETKDSYPVLDSTHGTVYYGTDCAGTAIYSNSTVPAAEHNLMHVDENAATCTTAGNAEYWYCSVCGNYFSDSLATTEISQSLTVISAFGHSLTYTASGNTITESCANNGCGHSATATITSPVSLVYDGTAKAASVSYGDGWSGGTLTVTYKDASNQTIAASEVVNAGTYTGEIKAGGVTASVTFYISKADPSVTVPVGLTATYGDTLANVELPDGWSWYSSAQSVGSAGENTFAATYTPEDKDNYNTVQADITVKVAPLPVVIVWDATDFVYDGTQKTVTPSVSNAVTGDIINLTVRGNEATEAGSYTATVTEIDNANYTLTGGTGLTNSWTIVDLTAPTGVITVAENSFRSFINTITFGIFCKDKYDVTITAEDAGTAVASIEYLISETAIARTDIASVTGWQTYSGAFAIEYEGAYIIYAKITDTAGNITYISSDGLVIDQTVPAISGIEDGGIYCGAVTVTVFDDYLNMVTVNGVEQTLTNNSFTVNPAEGEQTITVTDKAGNSTAYKVTVNDGHKWNEGKVTSEATCTVDGVMTYTCTVCGETRTETIPATGHTADEAVIENKVEATCTKDGSYDTVVYCTVCGVEISRETTVVPATGHSFGEWEEVTSPTCEDKGSERHTCTVCGYVETRDVDATGHDWEEDYTIDQEPSCTADGSRSIHCKHCDAVKDSETISATGHTAGEAVIENKVNATCMEEGSYDTVIYCTVCGEEMSREKTIIPATGHTTGEAVIENEVEATCTEDGSYDTVVYCTVCGEEVSRETVIVPATGHSFGDPVWNWSSDNTTAVAVFTCENDAFHTETVTAVITITESDSEILYIATVTLDGQTWTDERTATQEEKTTEEETTTEEEATTEENTTPEETTVSEETTAAEETTTVEETTATPSSAEEDTTVSGGSSSVTGDISVGIWVLILFASGTLVVCILWFGKKREEA